MNIMLLDRVNSMWEKTSDKVKDTAKKASYYGELMKILTIGGVTITSQACDLFNKEDPDPKDNINATYINPAQGSFVVPKGEPIEHTVEAENESGRPVLYEFSLNGITVQEGSSDNSYDMPRSDPGDNLLLAIMYSMKNGSEVARDTFATWDYNVLPTEATAIDAYLDLKEEETKAIAKTELENNPDNLDLEYSVTTTSGGVTAEFVGDSLEITGNLNYFGNYEVNFQQQGATTDYGTVSGNIANIDDIPEARNAKLATRDGRTTEVFVGDTLWVTYDYFDVEGDLEGNTIINDYINSVPAGTGDMILTNNLNENDEPEAAITPIDINDVQGTSVYTNKVILKANPYKIITGNITEIFNEGVSITGADVQFGNYNTTTNTQGEYRLEVDLGTIARLIINHQDFHERQTSSFAPTDTTLNETMVEGSFNMEHYNLITRYRDQTFNPGTQRWVDAPTVYIDTSPAPNGGILTGTTTPVTQANIDMALEVIADLPQFAVDLFPGDQVNVEIGTNPPEWGTEEYIVFSWNNTLPGMGEHGETVEQNIIKSARSKARTTAGRSTYIQELTQNIGARNDSNIVTPSVLNQPSQGEFYFKIDLKTGKLLYSRPPGNLFPDIDK